MAYYKPKDYDQVGNFKTLPADGYICRIKKAEETSSATGIPMLKIGFDILEGEYANYFSDLFNQRKAEAQNPDTVKWPFNGTKWISMLDDKGRTTKTFKSFCTALENSGTEAWTPNDTLNIGEFKGAQIGVIFRREEHEYEGKKTWRTVPWGFRSVESIDSGDFYVPEDKPFKAKPTTPYGGNSFTPSRGYAPNNNYRMPNEDSVGAFSATDDDIPF